MLTHIQIHNMSLLLSIYLYIHTTIHPFSSLTLSLYCIHTCMLSICQCFSQSIHLVIVLSIFSLIVVVGTPAVRMLVVRIAVYSRNTSSKMLAVRIPVYIVGTCTPVVRMLVVNTSI